MIELSKDEQAVYDLIVAAKTKITQLQIARQTCLGSHEVHEGYDVKDSTLRKVRQIIRDLRIEKGLFILSDTKGYWVMKSRDEVTDYLKKMETKAKASAKGYFETFRAMAKNFGVTSEYFVEQGKLFKND
jgi:hypothetical protein